MMVKRKNHLIVDLGLICISILIAVILVKTGFIEGLLDKTGNLWGLESFLSGMLFTSAFTTAIAMATLGEIAIHSGKILEVAFFGAMGAMLVDLIIFRLVRDRFSEDLEYILKTSGANRLRYMLHRKIFRWLSFFIGAFIIASPLPDELGVTLMGFSKAKVPLFAAISFIFNFLGISLICLIATSL